jgi:putative FmdB family regulatory protein
VPTYEYECTACGHSFEIFQNMADKPLEKCPKCHKKVKRLIGGGSGIIFKGSGFYATDYRKKSKGDVPPGPCPKAKDGCNGCQLNK